MVGVDIVKDVKIAEVIRENMHNIFFRSRSGIYLFQSEFKLIKFDDSKKKQAEKQIRYENDVANIANIAIIEDNNRFLFKNNIEYV